MGILWVFLVFSQAVCVEHLTAVQVAEMLTDKDFKVLHHDAMMKFLGKSFISQFINVYDPSKGPVAVSGELPLSDSHTISDELVDFLGSDKTQKVYSSQGTKMTILCPPYRLFSTV